MKRKILMMFVLAVSISCVLSAYAQEKRLTMDEIVINLQRFSQTPITKESANKTLAKTVGEKGVDFALDADTERILRQNGANDKLILAIKKSIADKKSPAADKKISAEKTSVAEQPTDAEGYLNRAKMCREYDYDCRIKNYDKAIELDPKNAVAYKLRGNAYSSKNNHDQAISNYTKAIELDPKFFDAYKSRSTAYELKGEFENAIGDDTKALEIKPKDAYTYNNRGNLYRYLLNFEKAIADFSKAIEIEPDNVEHYEDRANTYFQTDKCDLAIADYLKKIEVAKTPIPGVEITYRKLGDCYSKTGQHQKAIETYTKTIAIDPKYEAAYKGRAEMYEKIGETEKAKADRKKYQELID